MQLCVNWAKPSEACGSRKLSSSSVNVGWSIHEICVKICQCERDGICTHKDELSLPLRPLITVEHKQIEGKHVPRAKGCAKFKAESRQPFIKVGEDTQKKDVLQFTDTRI